MNYRELQLRQIIKRDYFPKTQLPQLVQDQHKELIKKNKDLLKNLEAKWKQEKADLVAEYQEQLKDINLLFDPQATNYENIDFNGLYSLLQQIAEREREQIKKAGGNNTKKKPKKKYF
jgi:hypothetical protein